MVLTNEESDVGSLSMKKEKQKSDVFGVWVKLKMPKQENGVDQKIKKNETKRVCHNCEKVFSSGKALGGHMRSHVQLPHHTKIKLHQNITFKNQDSEKSSNCAICGKNFPSMKSLFGHMRCHPEREWRGIHPPPSNPKNAAFSSSSSSSSSLSNAINMKIDDRMKFVATVEKDRAVDLTESLRGWPVTAKRGRKATAAAVGSSSELTRSSDDDAVNFLMMLAKGERKDFGEVVDDDKMKVLMKKKKKRKKVKLCDLNLMEREKYDQKCDDNNNNTPTCGKLLDFDLNEVPESEPQLLLGNYI